MFGFIPRIRPQETIHYPVKSDNLEDKIRSYPIFFHDCDDFKKEAGLGAGIPDLVSGIDPQSNAFTREALS